MFNNKCSKDLHLVLQVLLRITNTNSDVCQTRSDYDKIPNRFPRDHNLLIRIKCLILIDTLNITVDRYQFHCLSFSYHNDCFKTGKVYF